MLKGMSQLPDEATVARISISWGRFADGQWWRFRPYESASSAERRDEIIRRKEAARRWAHRHDMKIQHRRSAPGVEELVLRFVPRNKRANMDLGPVRDADDPKSRGRWSRSP